MAEYVAESGEGQSSLASAPLPKLQQSHEGEHHDDHGGVEVPISRNVKLFSFCAAINSANLGYVTGVSTNAGRMIQDQFAMSDEQLEIFIGSLNFFSIFGALMSNYLSDHYGRRFTFVASSVGFIVGLLVQAFANDYIILMIGRAIVGLGVGVGLAIDPMYISEISPAKHRGMLVTWSEVGINVGIVMGFSMGIFLAFLSDDMEWRTMFLLGIIMPMAMIYLAHKVMPETPRWYALKYRYEEARSVLYQIYPTGYNVDLVLNDIKESLERERLAEKSMGWGAIFCPTPAFRRMLIVGLGTAMAQQIVGVDAIQYYLLDIIASSVDSPTVQNVVLVLLGLVKLVCILVAGKFMDTRGRRPLFFLSLIGMIASLLMVSFTYYIAGDDKPNATFAIVGLGLYLAFFSFGVGPGCWLIPSEVFATCIRAKAMSLATMLNRVAGTAFSASFLTMQATLTWEGFFLLLAVFSTMVLVFLYFLLPETKGHSLEDMSLYFAELTGDFSILDAERKLRVEQELQEVIASPAGGGEKQSAPEGGTLT